MTYPEPLICLIGPPASGKTTLAENLAGVLHAPVVRPRDAINRAVARYPNTIGLFPRDGIGRVPDASLGFALRVEIDHLPADAPVILENLPWDHYQLVDLYRSGRPIVMFYMHASDELVIDRRIGRRDCPKCYPRAVVTQDGQHCARCCYELTVRRDDEYQTFLDRLSSNREYAIRILGLAHKLSVQVFTLEATLTPDVITYQALQALSRLPCELAAPQQRAA